MHCMSHGMAFCGIYNIDVEAFVYLLGYINVGVVREHQTYTALCHMYVLAAAQC